MYNERIKTFQACLPTFRPGFFPGSTIDFHKSRLRFVTLPAPFAGTREGAFFATEESRSLGGDASLQHDMP